MEIRISEKEITAGVVAYLNSRGFNLEASTVKIDYVVGRKPAGISAVLIEGDAVAEVRAVETVREQLLTGQAETSLHVASEQSPVTPDPIPEPAETEALVESDPAPSEGTSLFK